jgi:hypothetical protein
MLKFLRRRGRAKKIGILNFFLLLIITIILGFSFLFIHEESYSLNNHLFISPPYYALKEVPLKIKHEKDSEVLHLFDLISPNNLKLLLGSQYKELLMDKSSCQNLLQSSDLDWLKKFSIQGSTQSSCQAIFKLKTQGIFMPWQQSLGGQSFIYLEVTPVTESAESCQGNYVLPILLTSTILDLSNFRSTYSETEALDLMKLQLVEVKDINCAPR